MKNQKSAYQELSTAFVFLHPQKIRFLPGQSINQRQKSHLFFTVDTVLFFLYKRKGNRIPDIFPKTPAAYTQQPVPEKIPFKASEKAGTKPSFPFFQLFCFVDQCDEFGPFALFIAAHGASGSFEHGFKGGIAFIGGVFQQHGKFCNS